MTVTIINPELIDELYADRIGPDTKSDKIKSYQYEARLIDYLHEANGRLDSEFAEKLSYFDSAEDYMTAAREYNKVRGDISKMPEELRDKAQYLMEIWRPVTAAAGQARRRYYEEKVKETQKSLPEDWRLDPDLKISPDLNSPRPGQIQIENYIGGLEMPFGAAGPVVINGEYAQGEFYPVLATYETQLVAALHAGAKKTKQIGGVDTDITSDKMTRSVLLHTRGIKGKRQAMEFVDHNMDTLKEIVESRTRYGKLINIEQLPVGSNLYLRLSMETGAAMGMNMVTQAADDMARYIEKNCDAVTRYVTVSANLCTDKKSAAINIISGRGKTVDAGIIIPYDTMAEWYGIDDGELATDTFVNTAMGKIYVGSAKAGGMGGSQNSNTGNIIAGLFNAYGQDAGQITESSQAITNIRFDTIDGEKVLFYELHMPTLEIAAIGGGTNSRHVKKLLEALGIPDSEYPSKKFAEIIAGTTLSGELNTMLALSKGILASSHTKATR